MCPAKQGTEIKKSPHSEKAWNKDEKLQCMFIWVMLDQTKLTKLNARIKMDLY